MSTTMTDTPEDTDTTERLVFLKSHPAFEETEDQPTKTKTRTRKKDVADFQSYMIERLKADKAQVQSTTEELIEASRANMSNLQRIQTAVLRLLECNNFDDFIQTITIDLATILGVDITVLLIEADGQTIPHITNPGIRVLPEGTIKAWLGDKITLLEGDMSGIEAIYGGGAPLIQSQMLLRLNIAHGTPPALIAFGSRNPHMFADGQATDQVQFLGGVIERCFRTWLHLPQ